MDFRIRAASAEDIAGMHEVRGRVRENRLSNPRRITEASYRPYVAAGSAWVAETDAGIVGFAALDAPHGKVWALFVAPEAEGAGIARALHRRMIEWAQEQGLERLSLSTEAGSRAERFYREAGWIKAGLTEAGEVQFEMKLRG